MNVHEYRTKHAASVERWSHTIHNLMEGANVRDPVEILPEIVTAILQHAVLEAREVAEASARHTVQKMFRKVAAP
jgi:hypothetical protein